MNALHHSFEGALAPSPRGVTLRRLNGASCRWPLWGHDTAPDAHTSLYCGEPTVSGSSYCDCHTAKAGGFTRPARSAKGRVAARMTDTMFVDPDARPFRIRAAAATPRAQACADFASGEAVLAHYKEVKARLEGAPAPVPAPAAPDAEEPTSAPTTPLALVAAEDAIWWEEILDAVCAHYGVTSEALIGDSRMVHLVLARQVAMYLAYVLTGDGLSAIGRALGRDPSTVQHGVRKITTTVASNHAFAAEMESLRLKLIGGESA